MRAQAGQKNLGSIERVLRVLLGGALAVWALWMFLGGGVLVWRLLDVALIALGVDFVVTVFAAIARCTRGWIGVPPGRACAAPRSRDMEPRVDMP